VRWVLLIVVLYVLYTVGAAPDTTTPQSVTGAAPARQEPTTVETQAAEPITWAEALANDLGNPAPDENTLRFINSWIRAEGTAAMYNPLATSQTMPGSTPFNSHNVQNFTSVEQGLEATVITLHSNFPGYADIAEGIRTNDVERAFAGLVASPWGTQAGDVASIFNGPDSSQPVDSAPPAAATSQRDQVIQIALGQLGKPYILGTEGPDTFDCSGLVQWSYNQIGIATTRTTFTQLDNLRIIQPDQVQPGDMIYFQYSWDQHTGILADVNNDGKWDMIHAAAPGIGVIVTDDVFNDSFYTNAIIGYRTAF
jgi:cell wall-associated NlpC family hydrolase